MTAATRRAVGRLAGVGLGWRPEIAGFVRDLPATGFALGFSEVVAESIHVHDGRAEVPQLLADLRATGVPVVPHGIGLSLGGTDAVAPERVAHLAACATALDAPLVSEHIAFVRAGGLEAGHLLPLPRTYEAVDAVVANVRRARNGLPVPLALEPIAALFEWPDAQLTEAQFVTEILERTDALLLLDVANVYANARNSGRDPLVELRGFPLERIAYCHVAGGSADASGLYHDTHTAPVPPAVLELVTELSAELASHTGAWLLERDGDYPPAAVLRAELDALAAAADTGVGAPA